VNGPLGGEIAFVEDEVIGLEGGERPVHRVLRRHEDRSFPSFEADHFVLYESNLTPEGAIHDPQATYSLSD
jgi:2'-5' RNA ligase